MAKNQTRLPKGFSEHPTMGHLYCPHRDISCCNDCAMTRPEIVDVYGQHFWIADEAERSAFVAYMAEKRAS